MLIGSSFHTLTHQHGAPHGRLIRLGVRPGGAVVQYLHHRLNQVARRIGWYGQAQHRPIRKVEAHTDIVVGAPLDSQSCRAMWRG